MRNAFAATRRGSTPNPHRSDQTLAPRPAAALDEALAVGVVVVGELFSLPNRARRANPDHALLDVDITVRPARMVDEPRQVAADAGVDHCAIRELEAPDVALLNVAALPLQALLV